MAFSCRPRIRPLHALRGQFSHALRFLYFWSRALLERETLDEEEILEVTGLSPTPPLQNRKVPVPDADSRP